MGRNYNIVSNNQPNDSICIGNNNHQRLYIEIIEGKRTGKNMSKNRNVECLCIYRVFPVAMLKIIRFNY